jgi:carboxyl-terminal processing protease
MSNQDRMLLRVVGVILIANLFFGMHVYSGVAKSSGEDRGYQAIRQFTGVMKLIRGNYVDEDKVDYDNLINGAMRGMLGSLDRFSSYISPADYAKMREETEGAFGGIGVIISIRDEVLTVVAPQPDTPGARAGLKGSDQIVKVDGVETHGMTTSEAVGLIKGEPGSKVKLTIRRPDPEKTFDVMVERAIIPIHTVKHARFAAPDIGYVQLTQFSENSVDELKKQLKELRDNGALKGLIIDLRNNPGGLLDSAVDISSLFMPEEELVVFTQGRDKNSRDERFSGNGEKFLDFEVVILINEGSASAAEILAGCLKDTDRAVLVGEKTFGKGSVQSIIELDDSSAVRLTTAHYYTPSENVIHNNGIQPNVIVDISDEDARQLFAQRSRFEGQGRQPDEPEDIKDLQLEQGIALVKALLAKKPSNQVEETELYRSFEIQLEDGSSTVQPDAKPKTE